MKEPFQLNQNLLFLTPWMSQNNQLIAGFTTRNQGYSQKPYDSLNIGLHVGDSVDDVIKNRQLVAHRLNVSLEQFVFTVQLHTTTVKKVTRADCGAGISCFEAGIESCDGLYTTDKNVMLATFYADCTPLYFYVPSRELIGVAHAGWKGSVNGMMHQMLQTLKNVEHIDPRDIYVAIGPCIGRDAYRVDDTVINKLKKSHLDLDDVYVQISDTQYKLDTKALNKKQALAEGILESNILVSSYCTFTDEDLFFSHRRDKQSGRMMSFMCLNSTH